jgi:hypothetical protein
LDKLLPTLETTLQRRPIVLWEIAQELAGRQESLEIGEKYFRAAIRGTNVMNLISDPSPEVALIKVYESQNRLVEIRRLLLDGVPAHLRGRGHSNGSPSPTDGLRVQWIGRKLRSFNFPVDAIDVYLSTERTERFWGSDLVTAFGELKPESLTEYLETFDDSRQLSFHLFVRQSDPGRGRIQSRWNPLLSSISQDAKLAARTQVALDRLCATETDKLAPLVLSAQLSLATGQGDKSDALEKLIRFVDEHPLDKASSAEESNEPRVMLEAAQIALWLVARECLTHPPLTTMGEKLGQRSLQASRRNVTQQFTIAILTEWILIAGEIGDSETAKCLKQELDQVQPP